MNKKETAQNAHFKMLFSFTKGLGGKFTAAVIITSISILLSYLTPQVVRITVDSVIGEQPFNLPDFAVSWLNSFGGRIYLREHLLVCASRSKSVGRERRPES